MLNFLPAAEVAQVHVTKVERPATVKLSEDTKFFILLFVVIISMVMAFFPPTPEVAVFYDCRIAEISPDVPLKVKEECRKKMEKHSLPSWLKPKGDK